MAKVRYFVDDVDDAVSFYVQLINNLIPVEFTIKIAGPLQQQ